jgi:hypothetical protein
VTDTPEQRGGKRDRAGRKLCPGRVSITVRVARATAEKLRAWAEGPRKIGVLIDKLVDHWNKRPELGEFFGGFCGGVGASRSYCFVFPGAFDCWKR